MYEQETLLNLSEDANSKIIETNSKNKVLLFKVPNLNLYVISDCNNFGSNWIEVKFINKIYTAKYLMGEDEARYSVIARRFAQEIIERSGQKHKDGEFGYLDTRKLIFNIALKNTHPNEIRDISAHLPDF